MLNFLTSIVTTRSVIARYRHSEGAFFAPVVI
jgi:hypothetical protein